ncbi:hypothetical protein DUNSADRAFT_10913 [Dunaliella salina]|uniref:C3H1-type domain-containing protein n=1 Tax=Dunaliella salina TaxID=3046 RepID=A0ABQ7H4R3_DUNSA|nr:hypothetical protein DUNSADRAFT_10913 [Dunaliella salina]|eukprot:KAF5841850.1 hypothetical protein DUNSADRAFT_10913 [Dunaliella salina]
MHSRSHCAASCHGRCGVFFEQRGCRQWKCLLPHNAHATKLARPSSSDSGSTTPALVAKAGAAGNETPARPSSNDSFSMDISLDEILSGKVIPPSPSMDSKVSQQAAISGAGIKKGRSQARRSSSPPPTTSAAATPEEAARRLARSCIAKSLVSRVNQSKSSPPLSPTPSSLVELELEQQEPSPDGQQDLEHHRALDVQAQQQQQQQQQEEGALELVAPRLLPSSRRRRSRLFQLLEPVPVPIPASTSSTDSMQTDDLDSAMPGGISSSRSSTWSSRSSSSSSSDRFRVSMGGAGRSPSTHVPGPPPASAAPQVQRTEWPTTRAVRDRGHSRSQPPALPFLQQQQQQLEQDQGLPVVFSTKQRRSHRRAERTPLLQQLQQPSAQHYTLEAGEATQSLRSFSGDRERRNLRREGGGTGSSTYSSNGSSFSGNGHSRNSGPAVGGIHDMVDDGGGGVEADGNGWGRARPSVRRKSAASPRGAPPSANPQEVLAEMAAAAEAQRALRATLLAHQERRRQQQQQQLVQEAEHAALEQELAGASPQQQQQVELLRQMAARAQGHASHAWGNGGVLAERDPSEPRFSPPPAPYVDSSNWVQHAKASFPHVYDPGYHTTLYELLFDVWMELGKAHQNQQSQMIRASYAFLELCYNSQDMATRHVAVVSFAEALGDSDSLQAAAPAHVQPQELLLDALQPLVQWMHGDELGQGGLLQEFWAAAQARTALECRRREARAESLRHAAAVGEVSRRAIAQLQPYHGLPAARASTPPARSPQEAHAAAMAGLSQGAALQGESPAAGDTSSTPADAVAFGEGVAGLDSGTPVPKRRGRRKGSKSRGASGAALEAGQALQVEGHAGSKAPAIKGPDGTQPSYTPTPQVEAGNRAALDMEQGGNKMMAPSNDARDGVVVGDQSTGGSMQGSELVRTEWEQLMRRLSAMQEVHPAVPKSALICIAYD